jgi:hypothetical protein
MNEHDLGDDIRDCGPSFIRPLDAELTVLIEFVWACEAAARREDRIDAAIRYGTT